MYKTSRDLIKRNLHVEGVFKWFEDERSSHGFIFGPDRKLKNANVFVNGKRDARRRFQAYVRRRRVVSQLFLLLLTRNFFPLVPVRKIWAKLFKSSS